ncbi:MAG TPA: 6-phosphogluconolactonase [Anaerolineae bacterium]|nr:6-phosphogluconolactonase [Anaerolineae bacterium]
MTLHIFPSSDQLSNAVGRYVAAVSAAAIEARGRFVVALSGGSLPRLLSAQLIIDPLRGQIDWSAWHVFFADERCVPLDHADSNYRLAKEQLFDHVPIPSHQIYPIDPTLDPQAAATAYQLTINNEQISLPSNPPTFQPSPLPIFDLILLGLGEDGHTASLFPGHPLLNETERWVAPIFDSPKPPPERITLTLPVLNRARHVAFITTGAGKAEVLPEAIGTETVPAGLVRPVAGTLDWFVDAAAAANLKDSSP